MNHNKQIQICHTPSSTSIPVMETTTIFQYSTTTPLAASSDDSNDGALLDVKRKLKQIISTICSPDQPEIGNITSPPFTIHYSADRANDLLVVVITKTGFPDQLALSYIAELHDEFTHVHTPEMKKCIDRGEMIRPYQFMQFETFISKTKKVYADSRAKDGLNDISNQLRDVKHIMNKNINDLLNRGEELNNLHDLSSALKEQSIKYKKFAKKINWDLFVKKYTPVAIVGLVFLLLIYRWFM